MKSDYLFRVTSDRSHNVFYLRQEGYGVYTGKGEHGFNVEVTEKYLTNPETQIDPLKYFTYTLTENGYSSNFAEVELNTFKEELVPYYPYERYESDVGVLQYAIEYYAYDYLTSGLDGLKTSQEIATQEQNYRSFVYDNYLTIDGELETLLLQLADGAGINANADRYTVAKQVVNYVKNAAEYNLAFDAYPKNSDMVTYFLTESKEGVCRHFAAAATMMFRALGIPARYTIGFAVPVFANTWTEWRDAGHAWTEIYLDGYGWVPLEVTGSNFAPDSSEDEPDKEEDGGVSYYVYLQEEKRYAAGTPKGER